MVAELLFTAEVGVVSSEEDSLTVLGADQINDVTGAVAVPRRPAARFRSAFPGFAKPFYQQLGVPCVSIFLAFPLL